MTVESVRALCLFDLVCRIEADQFKPVVVRISEMRSAPLHQSWDVYCRPYPSVWRLTGSPSNAAAVTPDAAWPTAEWLRSGGG